MQSTGVPITDPRGGTRLPRPRIRGARALTERNPPTLTVAAVTPGQGKTGTTVSVTIDGTGFVTGAGVNAGAGITVSNVAVLSATRLTARFAIAAGATLGGRNVKVTIPSEMATLNNAFTVVPAVTLNLAYNGKLRDRVGGGDTARTPDGALDGTLTLTLNATDGRTINALRLQNASGGAWATTGPHTPRLTGPAAPPSSHAPSSAVRV